MRFKKVYIELSDKCGLNCKFCPTPKNKRPVLTPLEFEFVLQKFRPYCDFFTMHILGDPMILDIKAYLEVARKLDVKIDLTTSGFYLKDKIEMILSYNLAQFNISLASFFWQNLVKFDDYIEPILEFCDKFSGDGFVNLRLWNFDKSNNPLNDNSIFYNKFNSHFNIVIDEKAPKFRLKRHILLTQSRSFNWPFVSKNQKTNTFGSCYGLIHQIGVLSSGKIVPCCMDASGEIVLGDIFCDELEAVFKSERFQNIVSGFRQNILVEKLCQACEFREVKFECI